MDFMTELAVNTDRGLIEERTTTYAKKIRAIL